MRWLAIIAVVAGTGCSRQPTREPSAIVIDRLEAKLSANPCIGSLSRWSRSYAYAADPLGGGDRHSLVFVYEEAGKFEFREGRHVFRPGGVGPKMDDDRSYLVAYGAYDPTTDEIRLVRCGL